MEKKDEVVNLGIQIDKSIRDMLVECAKKEKRTLRAVVEIALEEHYDKYIGNDSKGGR